MTTALPDISPKRSPWRGLVKGLAVASGLVAFIAVLMLWLSGFFDGKSRGNALGKQNAGRDARW